MSWSGIKVRNDDGREGVIASEYIGFCHRHLAIKDLEGCDLGHVQLNSNGPDTGETGWWWFCEELAGGAEWLQLGDHNAADKGER